MFVTFMLRIVMKNAGENVNAILLYITCRFPTKISYAFSYTTFGATSFPYHLLLNTITQTLFDGDYLRHEEM
jgi:hypothetical protein